MGRGSAGVPAESVRNLAEVTVVSIATLGAEKGV